MVGLKIVYVFTKDVDELDARGVAVRFSSIVMESLRIMILLYHLLFMEYSDCDKLYSPANHFLY